MDTSDFFFKGADKKINPSDFVFQRAPTINLGLGIQPSLGGGDRKWNIPIYLLQSPTQGDYNTPALILKMATARFVDVFEEETNKMKENAVALIIT